MKNTIFFALATLLFTACSRPDNYRELDIIPYPQSVNINLDSVTHFEGFRYSAEMPAEALNDLEQYLVSFPLKLEKAGAQEGSEANLVLSIAPEDYFPSEESYELVIGKGVQISAKSYAGLFYGLQSLAQICASKADGAGYNLPALTIRDTPRFSWRGLHLDVSRHFFDVDFVKKQIDAIASFKLNVFHWHLTDGTGWRLEIPQYPKLTEGTAWRPYPVWKDWWYGKDMNGDDPNRRRYCTKDTPGAYGGYYTADDVREVVEYARLRNITVIPEIEMPGHSEEVLAVYPELSCSGEPYKNSEFCVGNEATYKFLEDVLGYVIDLFPSEYIHIGGDEADKSAWKKCPKCQALKNAEEMESEDELQSYLIHRVEVFINSKGRKLLGWDEILEGGLAPNATVMSWRGTEGGIKAATAGHDVVMTPGKYCYLDAYQDDPETQPEANGGYRPLEEVYSYDPAPDGKTPVDKTLSKTYAIEQAPLAEEVRKHIIGVQGNVWAEYIPTDNQAEYMIYPRILAIAEVGWTYPENKSWESFRKRANRVVGNDPESTVASLQSRGYHPFTLSEQVKSYQDVKDGYIEVSLCSEKYPSEIRYTLDGSEVTSASTLYTKPLIVRDSANIAAKIFTPGKKDFKPTFIRADYHKGIGKKATYNSKIYSGYAAGGETALTDGYRGGKGYGDGRWQGFCPNELEVVIDLGKIESISTVHALFMQVIGPSIQFPSKVEVYGSPDNVNFTLLGEDICDVDVNADGVLFRDFGWKGDKVDTRYVKFIARQSVKKVFIFTDEIIIQ